MERLKIKVKRIGHHKLPLPEYATDGSGAVDLRARIEQPLVILPGETHLVPCGFAFAIHQDVLPGVSIAGMLMPRSGLGHKHGIVLGNIVGWIDSDFVGEVHISMWNRGSAVYTVDPGERVCQMAFLPVFQPQLIEVDALDDTARGDGGFGHSGEH